MPKKTDICTMCAEDKVIKIKLGHVHLCRYCEDKYYALLYNLRDALILSAYLKEKENDAAMDKK